MLLLVHRTSVFHTGKRPKPKHLIFLKAERWLTLVSMLFWISDIYDSIFALCRSIDVLPFFFFFSTRKAVLCTRTKGLHKPEFRSSPGLPRGLRGQAWAPAVPAQTWYKAPLGWQGDTSTATACTHRAVRHPSPTGTHLQGSHTIGNGLNTESSSKLRSLTRQEGLGTPVSSSCPLLPRSPSIPWSHPGLPEKF